MKWVCLGVVFICLWFYVVISVMIIDDIDDDLFVYDFSEKLMEY